MSKFKTDNASLATKVRIRRWLVAQMGFEEVRVLDTCCGLGAVWAAMEEHVTIRQWTRCDVKPRRPDVLKLSALDSVKRFAIDTYNVIDIDPYGEPWEIYHTVLPKIASPTAVFLTRGHVGTSGVSMYAARTAGIPDDWFESLPRVPAVPDQIAGLMLAETWRHATIRHAGKIRLQSRGGSSVTYYALGLDPL